MKRLIGMFATLLIPIAVCGADPCQQVALNTSDLITTNIAITGADILTSNERVDGYIERLELMSTYGSVQTCSVAIVTTTNFAGQIPIVIYSNAAFSGCINIRPRYLVQDWVGGNMAVTSNQTERAFLTQDKIRMYLWNSTSTNNTGMRLRVDLWR